MTIAGNVQSNMQKMARSAEEMAEAQGSAYEALANNAAALQRRNVGFAQEGLKFMRLQESSARAAREWWASGLRLLGLQQRNFGVTRDWFSGSIAATREQAEHNLRTATAFAQSARKQQEAVRGVSEGWANLYRDFFSPVGYAQQIMTAAGRATEQGLRATQQATEETTRQGLRMVEEASEQAERVVRQAEEVIQEAELHTAVSEALGTESYEELSVSEVSKKLDGLSKEDLKRFRAYEKRNKNRETLVTQIDRKINSES